MFETVVIFAEYSLLGKCPYSLDIEQNTKTQTLNTEKQNGGGCKNQGVICFKNIEIQLAFENTEKMIQLKMELQKKDGEHVENGAENSGNGET